MRIPSLNRLPLSPAILAVLIGTSAVPSAHADSLARGTAAYSRGDYIRAARELTPLALRGMLDCVNVGGECALEEGLEYESAQFGLVFSTDDMREGTGAFLEKRAPEFKGR